MGSWGVGPFQSDAALELVEAAGFDDAGAANIWRATLDASIIYEEVVAAAAVVAASLDPGFSPETPNRLTVWLAIYGRVFGPDDGRRALEALERVTAPTSSCRPAWVSESVEREHARQLELLRESLRRAFGPEGHAH